MSDKTAPSDDDSPSHPPRNASRETLRAYHEALKHNPVRWRSCRPLRIEPDGHFFREFRACAECSAELARPARLVRLAYFEDLFIPPSFTMDQIRREALKNALRTAEGNLAQAAELLGISRRAAYYWASEFGLSAEASQE